MGIPISSDLGPMDFAGIARCMGGEGSTITRADGLETALRSAADSPVPVVIDVQTSAEATPVVALSRIRDTRSLAGGPAT